MKTVLLYLFLVFSAFQLMAANFDIFERNHYLFLENGLSFDFIEENADANMSYDLSAGYSLEADRLGLKLIFPFRFSIFKDGDFDYFHFKSSDYDEGRDYLKFVDHINIGRENSNYYIYFGKIDNYTLANGNLVSSYMNNNYFDDDYSEIVNRGVIAKYNGGEFEVDSFIDDVVSPEIFAHSWSVRPLAFVLENSFLASPEISFSMASAFDVPDSKRPSVIDEKLYKTDFSAFDISFKMDFPVYSLNFTPHLSGSFFPSDAKAFMAGLTFRTLFDISGREYNLSFDAAYGISTANYVYNYFDSFYDLSKNYYMYSWTKYGYMKFDGFSDLRSLNSVSFSFNLGSAEFFDFSSNLRVGEFYLENRDGTFSKKWKTAIKLEGTFKIDSYIKFSLNYYDNEVGFSKNYISFDGPMIFGKLKLEPSKYFYIDTILATSWYYYRDETDSILNYDQYYRLGVNLGLKLDI